MPSTTDDVVRVQKKFDVKGFGLVLPGDRIPDNLLQLARNVRIFNSGEIRIRPGLTLINITAMVDGLGSTQTHSLFQLNDPTIGATQTYAIIAGTGNRVFTDNAAHNAFSDLLEGASHLGFSGNLLSFVAARPFQSSNPWCYIGDSTRTRKIRADGLNYQWGCEPPSLPLTTKIGIPTVKIVTDFEADPESAVAWVVAGTAGAITVANRLAALVVTYFQFDVGSTGWASVVPATFPQDIQPGMLLKPSVNTEAAQVTEVFEQITSTTIDSITYDNAPTNTGKCTIQPAIAAIGIKKNMLLRIAGAENVLVESVTESPDGVITSFRTSTTATRAATNAIDGLRSFRAYFTNTHSAVDTLTAKMFQVQVTVGTGTITHTLARDLSNASGRPLADDDDVHISFWIDNSTLLTELRVEADFDAAVPNFTQNKFMKVFRPSDFASAIAGSQTISAARPIAVARYIADQRATLRRFSMFDGGFNPYQGLYPNPLNPLDNVPDPIELDPLTSTPIGTGTNQWFELRCKLSDFKRIGTDQARGWKDIAAIRISVQTTNTVNIQLDAWTIGGTYGPSSPLEDPQLLPYYYTYRYRSSLTGTKSNFAPPTRSGVFPRRTSVILTPTYSTDPQVDKIDYIRFGGALAEWQLLGTGDNSTPFTDIYPDSALLGKTPVNLTDDFQPFPTIDLPRTGTCNVSGTSVTRVSPLDIFNPRWARNSEIFINGTRCTLYAPPSSVSKLELNESMGTLTGATFFLPEPTLQAAAIPSIWGPMGGAIFGDVIFACRDSNQPGVLFYTNPGNPDSTKDINQLEICSGSEQLLNGCLYRGRSYVASNRRWYEITPRFGYGYSIVDNLGAFIAQDTANNKGLFGASCLAVGDYIYYRGEDGIYRYNGGAQELISGDLYPLFPHGGVPGERITLTTLDGTITVIPPNDATPDLHRMEFGDGLLYYTYPDLDGIYHTLVYSTFTEGWNSEDTFTPEMRVNYSQEGKGFHSLIYGGRNGKVYRSTVGVDDASVAIPARLLTGSDDEKDVRANKEYQELWVDGDGDSSTMTAMAFLANYKTLGVNGSLVVGADRDQTLLDIGSKIARNIAAYFKFSIGSLFGWGYSYTPYPEDTTFSGTAYDDDGDIRPKWLQGFLLEADTLGLAVLMDVIGDNETIIETISINHPKRMVKDYSLDIPYITHQMKLVPHSGNVNIIRMGPPFKLQWRWEPEPPLALVYMTQPTNLDQKDFFHLGDIFIAHRSTQDLILTISLDNVSKVYTIPHSSGVQVRSRVLPDAVKGLMVQFRISSSAGTRIYVKDCSVDVGQWGREEMYEKKLPFGDVSRQIGATI